MTELRPLPEIVHVEVKDRTAWWRKALMKIGVRTGIYRYTIAEDIIEFNHGEHEYPRGPSQIIFKWDAREQAVQGICYTSGDADYENDTSMLDTYCEDAIDDKTKTAWYVIDKFTMHYWTDYYGEADGQPDWENQRYATFKDYNDIWFGGRAQWYLQIAAKLGLKMPAWWPEP